MDDARKIRLEVKKHAGKKFFEASHGGQKFLIDKLNVSDFPAGNWIGKVLVGDACLGVFFVTDDEKVGSGSRFYNLSETFGKHGLNYELRADLLSPTQSIQLRSANPLVPELVRSLTKHAVIERAL